MDHESAGPGIADDIPRGSLSFSFTRRELFRSLPSQGHRRRSEDDSPAYRLTALGALADEELAGITPVLMAGCRLSISDGMVWGQAPRDQVQRSVCAAEPANLLILRAIDGRTDLGTIAEQVEQTMHLSERSFAHVRDLFLRLVLAHMATPTQGAGWAV